MVGVRVGRSGVAAARVGATQRTVGEPTTVIVGEIAVRTVPVAMGLCVTAPTVGLVAGVRVTSTASAAATGRQRAAAHTAEMTRRAPDEIANRPARCRKSPFSTRPYVR
jgi:hypothetical protein